MRPLVALALALLLSSALANPFRDLYLGSAEPEAAPSEPTPIIIDLPLEQLPLPPLDLDAFPTLPAAEPSASAAPRITIPERTPTFPLGLSSATSSESILTIRASDPRPVITLSVLLAPRAVTAPAADQIEPEPIEVMHASVEEAAPALEGVEVLAVAAGERPSVLLTHAGERHLLRLGEHLPGTPYLLDTVTAEHITFRYDERSVELSLRRDAP